MKKLVNVKYYFGNECKILLERFVAGDEKKDSFLTNKRGGALKNAEVFPVTFQTDLDNIWNLIFALDER